MTQAINEAIREQAMESAQGLVAECWRGGGAEYELGAFHGDVEALEQRIGRPTTADERRDFETIVRAWLDEDGGSGDVAAALRKTGRA
jgi:hypothetical protein